MFSYTTSLDFEDDFMSGLNKKDKKQNTKVKKVKNFLPSLK